MHHSLLLTVILAVIGGWMLFWVDQPSSFEFGGVPAIEALGPTIKTTSHTSSGPSLQGQGAPAISVDPVSGPSGTFVTIQGKRFRSFTSVDKVEIGGINVLGGRTMNTDVNGDFAISNIVVPQLDAGLYNVTVAIGTETAKNTFQVPQAPPTPIPTATPTPIPTSRFSLYINGSKVHQNPSLVSIPNGFVTLSRTPASDGRYTADTKVNIAVHPDVFGATTQWRGIDDQKGSSATVAMTADRFVEVRITPPTPRPTRPTSVGDTIPTRTPTFTLMPRTSTPVPMPSSPTITPALAGSSDSGGGSIISEKVVVVMISTIGSIIVAYLGYLGVRAVRGRKL